MSDVTIYHNPKCSKSRKTLALIKESGQAVKVIEYLKTPPTAKVLAHVIKTLKISASDIVRNKEFSGLEVGIPEDQSQWIALMVANPQIIERPIVLHGDRVCIGRPPELVLHIL